MKLCFSTLGCPGWTVDDVARNAAEMGFAAVELRGTNGRHLGPDETPETIERVRALFGRAGVAIAVAAGYGAFSWPDPARQEKETASALRHIEVARRVGCRIVRVFCGRCRDGETPGQVRPRIIEGLKRAAGAAAGAGVVLAVETHDDWLRGEVIAGILDDVGDPSMGATWDVGNTAQAEPADATFAALKGRILHVHLKDWRKDEQGKHQNCLPGRGTVDWRRPLELLHGSGYAGALSFEWEKTWLPELEEPEVAFPCFRDRAAGLLRELGISAG